MANDWDEDFLRGLSSLSAEEAKRQASDLIMAGTTKGQKKAALCRDIQKARDANEVSRIMYYAYLAGSGLGLPGSDWQKKFGGVGSASH